MDNTYREKFTEETKPQKYDEGEYAKQSYSSILWDVERQLLLEFLGEFRKDHSRIDYLDFAAGTGRIISALETEVDEAVGIEISPAMVKSAQEKLKSGKMVCTDITAPDAPIEGQYDLITAFRFFLNAETSLRKKVMKGLASRLKDETSRLVFNNHGNPYSHKMAMVPYHFIRNFSQGYRSQGNYMTHKQVESLAMEAGLTIEKVLGYGILSSKALIIMPFERLLAAEKRLSKSSFISRYGVNQMYIAKKIS